MKFNSATLSVKISPTVNYGYDSTVSLSTALSMANALKESCPDFMADLLCAIGIEERQSNKGPMEQQAVDIIKKYPHSKIEAIKAVRQFAKDYSYTPLEGLAEAKNFVDKNWENNQAVVENATRMAEDIAMKYYKSRDKVSAVREIQELAQKYNLENLKDIAGAKTFIDNQWYNR